MSADTNLIPCLLKIAQLQGESLDRLALQEALQSNACQEPRECIDRLMRSMHLDLPRWEKKIDPTAMPVLIHSSEIGWGVLRGQNAYGQWICEWWVNDENQWKEEARESLVGLLLAKLKCAKSYVARNSAVYQLIRDEVFSNKKLLLEAVVAGIVVNSIVLATSMYTMLVYDRVVPTGASQTLLVLTLGVFVAIAYEFVTKRVRSRLFEQLIEDVDRRLARSVYMRFLAIRLDQLPQSVGGLASQMRGYESVRSFLVGATTHVLVDAPYALLFVTIIYLIAGWLALIPLVFFCLSIIIGWYYKGQVTLLAQANNKASNFKTGLLVETVEGSETIKSGQGGWRMLSRWMETTDEARTYELSLRNISEHSQYLVASFQQFSYISLVASGALLISQGGLTIGSLIACSILSGRVLAPVAAIPNQLVQWGHTKAALRALDALWGLKDDHHGQQQPLTPENIIGGYQFEQVIAQYGDTPALSVESLKINPGEKIAVLGPVGAGKTTLLRLLSGMYKPQSGRVMLDDVDLSHISKSVLAEHMGYVQQEGRLFAGTVRENLILGLLDPGDRTIIEAAKLTGLMQAVIAMHPQGMQQPIFEGGTGLSGGQRQLVNLTRAFLREPNIWLLDEPTASMDRSLELQIINALRKSIKPEDTLVLVTHKMEMLDLADRIIVITKGQVAIDGSKDEVLNKLEQAQRHNLKPVSGNQPPDRSDGVEEATV